MISSFILFFANTMVWIGCAIIFIGCLGFYRFPRPLQRFHPVTLATVAGLGLVLIGEAIDAAIRTSDWLPREWLALPLIFVISPLTAHLLSKYISKNG